MLEQWASIGEIAASFAVIVSLIYVARQLKQGTDAMRAASRQAAVSTDVAVLDAANAYPEIIAARYKDELTYEEKVRLDVWLIQLIRSREHLWLQYDAGMLDERAWRAYLSGLAVNLCYPRTRAYWDTLARHWFDSRFVREVDDYLSTVKVETDFRLNIEKVDDQLKAQLSTE